MQEKKSEFKYWDLSSDLETQGNMFMRSFTELLPFGLSSVYFMENITWSHERMKPMSYNTGESNTC